MHGAGHGIAMNDARDARALDGVDRVALVGAVQHREKCSVFVIDRNGRQSGQIGVDRSHKGLDVGNRSVVSANTRESRISILNRGNDRKLVAGGDSIDGVDHALKTGAASRRCIGRGQHSTRGELILCLNDHSSGVGGGLLRVSHRNVDRLLVEGDLDVGIGNVAVSSIEGFIFGAQFERHGAQVALHGGQILLLDGDLGIEGI